MPFEEGQDFLADLHRVPFKGKAADVIGNGSAVGTKTIIHCCPKCSLGRVILILVARRACRRATPDAQETFYRSASGFSCKLFAVHCFKFEDPGSMFDLVKVV